MEGQHRATGTCSSGLAERDGQGDLRRADAICDGTSAEVRLAELDEGLKPRSVSHEMSDIAALISGTMPAQEEIGA